MHCTDRKVLETQQGRFKQKVLAMRIIKLSSLSLLSVWACSIPAHAAEILGIRGRWLIVEYDDGSIVGYNILAFLILILVVPGFCAWFVAEQGKARRSYAVSLYAQQCQHEAERLKELERQLSAEAVIRLAKFASRLTALFGLRFEDETEAHLMLEIDRGEMPVDRYRTQTRTYFTKKMATYWEAYRQKDQLRELGIEAFRVVTVTTTQSRVEKMISALRRITGERGSNIFLFACQERLAAAGDHLELEWLSGRGEPIRLSD